MIHPAPMVNHAIVGDLEEKKDDDIRSAAAALPKDGKSATTEKPTTAQARENLLKVLVEHRIPNKFSSTPLHMDVSGNSMHIGGRHGREDSGMLVDGSSFSIPPEALGDDSEALGIGEPSLTKEERQYLAKLITEGDAATLAAAKDSLTDETLFPTNLASDRSEQNGAPSKPPPHSARRDSKVQQKLFQIHQEKAVQPSKVLKFIQQSQEQNSLLQSSSRDFSEEKEKKNKLQNRFRSTAIEQTSEKQIAAENDIQDDSAVVESTSWDPLEPENSDETQDSNVVPTAARGLVEENSERGFIDATPQPSHESSFPDVDTFEDIASWIDGGQGVEVNDSGIPLEGLPSSASLISRDEYEPNKDIDAENANSDSMTLMHHPHRPFKILGTSANDVSCHPHVMSPPLMESLLAFMPEELSNNNYWLKYSLVRDAGNLWTMLRHMRASNVTALAIETTDGHVFGSFTYDAWRFSAGWYGSSQAFLWKMRHSRLETTKSIFEQALQESEVQVFPVRPGNVAIQYCSKECLMLGRGEIKPDGKVRSGGVAVAAGAPFTKPTSPDKEGKHYGHGIFLDHSLQKGSTSSSETFGNPCLIDEGQRGMKFEV